MPGLAPIMHTDRMALYVIVKGPDGRFLAVIIVEVDERGHEGYKAWDEVTRAMKIKKVLGAAVHFFRYHPDCLKLEVLAKEMIEVMNNDCSVAMQSSAGIAYTYIGYKKARIEELNVWAQALNNNIAIPFKEVLST